MNKTAIKNFAVWARQKLISDVSYKMNMLGITEDAIAQPLPQSTKDLQFFDIGTKNYAEVSGDNIAKRNAIVSRLKAKERDMSNLKEAFQYVVEEVAYTWFNRLIAIRFMEVNGYLPSGIRVLSSENKSKNEPDFVTTPFDTDLEFTPYEQDRVVQLKDENKLDELFRFLFLKQCNKLGEILPELFEKSSNTVHDFASHVDFSELLLTISFTDKDGVVYHLVHDIDEDDFDISKEGQVEIIGWMYQYYNIEPKAAVFARASGQKIKKEDIPAATQLFTPDWIVRYMVENSLGRLWLEGHSDFDKSKWIYYLDEAEQEESVKTQLEALRNERRNLKPEEIKFIDPCMGSGHILVYAFDVLMQIYESYGYTARDAARSILKNNLFGLDIDKRAYQLAYFAVMMKARQYNRRILTEETKPNLCYVRSSMNVPTDALKRLGDCKSIAEEILDDFKYADEYGSMLQVNYKQSNLDKLEAKLDEIRNNIFELNLVEQMDCNQLLDCFEIVLPEARFLSQKYDAVVTNPPYMAVSNAGQRVNDYVKANYPDSKADMFAVFMERCKEMVKPNRYQAMITMHSWMFLSSFEKLREKLLRIDTVNMAHLGARAFEEIGGEVVQTTSFILRNSCSDKYRGVYCRLTDPNTQKGKETMFLDGVNRYITDQSNLSKMPGSPVAYWVSKAILHDFEIAVLAGEFAQYKHGMSTGKNEAVVRIWHEVSKDDICFNADSHEAFYETGKKFVPYNKGGEYRKWFGNQAYILGYDRHYDALMDTYSGHRHDNKDTYFNECISWSKVSSSSLAMRYFQKGFVYDVAGCSAFAESKYLKYLLAFYNLKVKNALVAALSPTLNFEVGQLRNSPIIFDAKKAPLVDKLTQNCITLSKSDWDAFETYWDFKWHPLVRPVTTLAVAYSEWEAECNARFDQLKANEEELNRIFIDIYGLQDELTPEVEDKDVTVRKADLKRDIRSLVSYAVGCMFGRYSLDVDGLAYAGGDWDNSKYTTYIPDADNCIPITDEPYFEDDIVGRFVEFIKVAYGEKYLEENLTFIANALGNKGTTSRDMIRDYFLNDFMADHIKIYQKRPIYWLFDSGKQNGFKALCYMHRWNADTTGNMRVEYLHRMQRVYEKEIERMQDTIDNSRDSKEVSAASKRKEKLQKQLKETKEFDAKVAHLALSRIDLDLDDGVKVNYEKVQTAQDGKKMQILFKL